MTQHLGESSIYENSHDVDRVIYPSSGSKLAGREGSKQQLRRCRLHNPRECGKSRVRQEDEIGVHVGAPRFHIKIYVS